MSRKISVFWIGISLFTALVALMIIASDATAQSFVTVCHPDLTPAPQVVHEDAAGRRACSLRSRQDKPVACGYVDGGSNCYYWMSANFYPGSIVGWSHTMDYPPYICARDCNVVEGEMWLFPLVMKNYGGGNE